MIIDANMYYIPEALFEDEALLERFMADIPEEDGWFGKLEAVPGTDLKQIVLEKPKGYQSLNYVQGDYVLETQLADLDRAGADKAFLKTPCCQEWMSLEMCRFFNDQMAEHCRKSGGRLMPLAVVPPYGTEENLAELQRCYDLGIRAVQLSAHYKDAYLDDERFAGFFERLNELHMNAYVHHTPLPVEYRSFYEYNNVRRSYGRNVDQGLAVGRELFSGFFDKYPNVKLVHAQLGGGFFALANMMFPKNAPGEAVSRFKSDNDRIVEQFKNNLYFEMSHAQPWGKDQLECAVKVLGADHIVFGTSYPVRKVWLTEGVDFVKALDITEEEKAMILGENARRLYLGEA